jgi:hypothetical protein
LKTRKSERRRSDSPIVSERRKKNERRKECPQCGSPLLMDSRMEPGFRQTTQVCTSSACSYTHVSRTVPLGKISLAPEYEIKVERSGQRLLVELPLELCHFAKLEPSQKLRLKAQSVTRWIIESD